MKVVSVSVSPPVGPSSAPTAWSKSQGIAPGATKAGSEEEAGAVAMAQTVLVSCECCHVARTCHHLTRSSAVGAEEVGDELLIVVGSNKVACGPKSVQAKPEPEGRQM